jgi:hypothetical protein
MTMNRRKFLQAAGAGAGLGLAGASSAFHNSDFGISPISGRPYIQPSYGDVGNVQVLGYCDMTYKGTGKAGGWDQIYDFKVRDTPQGRFAYCPNGAPGWSIVDVTNPRDMFVTYRQPWSFLPDNSNYLAISNKTGLMVPKRNQRIEVWDVNDPYNPTLEGTYIPPDIGTFSYHGLQIQDGTGPYRGRVFVFVAARFIGFTDMIMQILDITDPKNIREMSRWWYPGMNTAAGEVPTWPTDGSVTVQMHDSAIYGDRAYVAWRDKGCIILDISDIQKPRMVGEINWADGRPNFPSLPGQTHKFGLVVPPNGGPIETIISEDELGTCPFGYMHVIDVRDETLPREISEFKLPINLHGNCPKDRLGNRMGTHDMVTYITNNQVWCAWEEGGFWVTDISDIHHLKAVAWYLPPVRSDSARMTSHADDVFEMPDGIIFGSSSDAQAGGLWAMRYRKGFYGKAKWNSTETGVEITQVPRNDGGPA